MGSMDQTSGMGSGEFSGGQMGDTTQFLTPNDLISQRSSPDFMPGGKLYLLFSLFSILISVLYCRVVSFRLVVLFHAPSMESKAKAK